MVNGKPGDHPYTDIVAHGFDLEEPEVAARVRAVDSAAELDVQELLSDLLEYLLPGREGMPDDYQRKRLLMHLDTLERLSAGQGRKT